MEKEQKNKVFLTWKDIQDITGVSRSECYRIIQGLNEEQKEKGYRIIRGKVPAKIFCQRYDIPLEEVMA